MGAYDITTKFLIESHTADWLALAGIAVVGRAVRVIDADLSTIGSVPDKLIWVGEGRRASAIHLEFQVGRDVDLDGRVAAYNLLARRKHGVPVRSAVFLLKPDAGPPSVRGSVRWLEPAGSPLSFDYDLIRVWQMDPERLLAGGLGTLPLAPIAAVGRSGVRGVIRRVKERVDREVPSPIAADLMYATRILSGLRYNESELDLLFRGVQAMQESSYYQAILREGREEGEVLGERKLLVTMGTRKFGRPPAGALDRLQAVSDTRELGRLGTALLEADSWEEWLKAPAKPVRRTRAAR